MSSAHAAVSAWKDEPIGSMVTVDDEQIRITVDHISVSVAIAIYIGDPYGLDWSYQNTESLDELIKNFDQFTRQLKKYRQTLEAKSDVNIE